MDAISDETTSSFVSAIITDVIETRKKVEKNGEIFVTLLLRSYENKRKTHQRLIHRRKSTV